MLTVKLDEDLSPMVGEPLRACGHVTLTVAGQGWSDLKDADLWERVRSEGAMFVTADKGFGDIRAFPPGSHPGVILLRPDRESILDFRGLLEHVLSEHRAEALAGTLTVVTPRGIRIRRPPASRS